MAYNLIEAEVKNVAVNVDKKKLLSNIGASSLLNYTRINTYIPAHKQRAIIVATGPSLKDHKHLRKIRSLHNSGKYHLFSMNGSHDYLISKGIIPDFCVLFDASEGMEDIIKKPFKQTTYLVASRCSPNLFKKLEGANIILWDANDGIGEEELLSDLGIKWMLVGGGISVGLRTLSLSYILGYRSHDVFGLDSSIEASNTPPEANLTPTEGILGIDHCHQMPASLDKLRGEQGDNISFWAKVGDKFWLISPWMHLQKNNYMDLIIQLHGAKIKHHTEGLIPYIHSLMEQNNVI